MHFRGLFVMHYSRAPLSWMKFKGPNKGSVPDEPYQSRRQTVYL